MARDLSGGGDLKQSQKNNGYRAIRSRSVNITGEGVGAQAEEILARPGYCAPVRDAGLTDVGLYLDERQIWIVLAAPFAPSISAEAAARRVLDLVN